MKSYFIRLFDYDTFANKLLLHSIRLSGNPEKPVKLMAHLLAARQIWLHRCTGGPIIGIALWPDWQAETFLTLIDENHQAWLSFLNRIAEEDLEHSVSYKNSKGVAYQNKLADILGHVINHGTHHRAQAGQLLKTDGLEKLPMTDYIFYLRN